MTAPPPLTPELDVEDIAVSLCIYIEVFGFTLLFERPEEGFAMIEREGAHLMLEEADGPGRRFRTAPLEMPYGRGVNLQIRTGDVDALYAQVVDAGLEPLIALEDRWYRQDELERGARQFVIADPDGYLLRFFSDLGARPSPLPE